jgi:hypothetical protein
MVRSAASLRLGPHGTRSTCASYEEDLASAWRRFVTWVRINELPEAHTAPSVPLGLCWNGT